MIRFKGRLFEKSSSKFEPVEALVDDGGTLTIQSGAGEELASIPWKNCRISSRVGSIPRKITLPDGRVLETDDNDAVDGIERKFRHTGLWRLADLLERTPRYIVVIILLSGVILYAYLTWGIPLMARLMAEGMPREVEHYMTEQSFSMLDQFMLGDSLIDDARRDEVREEAAAVVEASGLPTDCCRIEFRSGGAIGANAFALPDGTVLVTDELMGLVESDDELMGVLAHELGHVAEDHALRLALQSSVLSLTIMFVTADLGQFGEIAVALPSILIESGYSRDFERAADAHAARTMVAMGIPTTAMADILQRLTDQAQAGGEVEWLSTHPATDDREEFFRNYAGNMPAS